MDRKVIFSWILLPLIAVLLCGCTSVAASNEAFQPHTNGQRPSPYPSEQTYTARPVELTVGSQPFANLKPQDVHALRVTRCPDQPPEVPKPCKVLDTDALIDPVVAWLSAVRIEGTQAQPNAKYTPAAGSDTLSIEIQYADGSTAQVAFCGSMMVSGYTYGFSNPEELVTIYDSLATPEWYVQKDGKLFSDNPDNAQFYVRRTDDGKMGELISHQGEKDTVLYPWVCLSPFVLGNSDGRLVFAGYSGDTADQRKVVRYYSIDEHGDDRKELDIRGHVASDPFWQGDALYYVGSSSDGEYPRPLNRASADFSRHIKVMDIPGPLVCLVGSKVYCLSQDRKSVVCMPDAIVQSYDMSIERIIQLPSQASFALIDSAGKQHTWKP